MATRTYRYQVTGTITVDETDLRTALLAMPMVLEAEDPTSEEYAEQSMEWLDHAYAATPKSLVELFVRSTALGLRSTLKTAKHSFPEVLVHEQPD